MSNNIFLFRLYILIMLFFLVPLSYIITLQLYHLLRRFIFVNSLTNMVKKDKNSIILYEQDNNILNLLLHSKKTFLCISFAELLMNITIVDIEIIYTLLAYSYQKSSFLHIAEYYYLKANSITSNNRTVLLGLASVYKSLGKTNELENINRKIDIIDNSYTKV